MKYGFTPAHPQLSTVVALMFLHVGFWHFFGNMWFLWMFGNRMFVMIQLLVSGA